MRSAFRFSGTIIAAMVAAASSYQWVVLPLMQRTSAARPTATLERGPRDARQLALTFDASSGAEGLRELLTVLEAADVRATFFLQGRWACQHPTEASLIAAKGHEIGNHGWSLKDLTYLEDWEIKREILLTDDRFVSWFGASYRPLFRAPLHAMDGRVLAIAHELGFRMVHWSIDPIGRGDAEAPASSLSHRVVGLSDDELKGAIVHFDVEAPGIAAAIPLIIGELRGRGFEFVPISAWTEQRLARRSERTDEASSLLVSPGGRGVSRFALREAPDSTVSFASAKSVVSRNGGPDHGIYILHHTTTKP